MSDDSHEYDEDAFEFIEDERTRIAALHSTCPKEIWLQIDPEAEQFDGWDAQTWCSERINDTDVRYVLAASRDAEVAELKESLRIACEIREGTTMGEQRLLYWAQLEEECQQLRAEAKENLEEIEALKAISNQELEQLHQLMEQHREECDQLKRLTNTGD